MARPIVDISPTLSAQSSSNDSRIHTPSSSTPETPIVPERPPSPEKKALQDSNTFLTALATQERKVLELREELQRAEASLDKLKKQWAIHEATKKRNELRHVEQLQPLSTSMTRLPDFVDHHTSDVLGERDLAKPRSPTARSAQRTVFSGSRHTKTLSLLSPKSPTRGQMQVGGTKLPVRTRRDTTGKPSRSKAAPDLTRSSNGTSNTPVAPRSRQLVNGPPKDAILETGKQLVGDFREGFRTFFEDLRQATVGEEIDTSNGHIIRKPISNTKTDTPVKAGTPWQQNKALGKPFPASASSLHGKSTELKKTDSGSNDKSGEINSRNDDPVATPSKVRVQSEMAVQTNSTDADGWDSWDSPPGASSPQNPSSTSNRTSDAMASPVTAHSSPRTSLR